MNQAPTRLRWQQCMPQVIPSETNCWVCGMRFNLEKEVRKVANKSFQPIAPLCVGAARRGGRHAAEGLFELIVAPLCSRRCNCVHWQTLRCGMTHSHIWSKMGSWDLLTPVWPALASGVPDIVLGGCGLRRSPGSQQVWTPGRATGR